MLLWVSLCIGVVISYLIYTLASSEGSGYENNSIDAFIEFSESGATYGRKSSKRDEKYKKPYLNPGWPVLIFYGTEYGFSQEVAQTLWERILKLNEMGSGKWQPRLVNVKSYSHVDLMQEKIMLLVISTAGDGVPPTDARAFYDFLMSSTQDLSHLQYSVLATGDSNYTYFCQAGRNMDTRLADLGAKAFVTRQDIDQENWSNINQWFDKVAGELQHMVLGECVDYLDLQATYEDRDDLVPSRTNPFPAKLKKKRVISVQTEADDKVILHCEFDLIGSKISWTSGDALGIYPENSRSEVEALLLAMNADYNTPVDTPRWAHHNEREKTALGEALMRYYDMKTVKTDLLQLLLTNTNHKPHQDYLNSLITPSDDGKVKEAEAFLAESEVADVLKQFSDISVELHHVLGVMKPLMPRYYSISSSPLIDKNTACVTAAVVRYETRGKQRTGVCTTYLEERLLEGCTSPVFISHNPDFHLPKSSETDIIMIGPGTGLAPFMAFLQEREQWASKGHMELRVAFSRDQPEKIYVQHLMKEDGTMLWAMIDSGAHLYVCGDAKHMAHDVNLVLCEIIRQHGQLSETDAQKYLNHLQAAGRYERDVWII